MISNTSANNGNVSIFGLTKRCPISSASISSFFQRRAKTPLRAGEIVNAMDAVFANATEETSKSPANYENLVVTQTEGDLRAHVRIVSEEKQSTSRGDATSRCIGKRRIEDIVERDDVTFDHAPNDAACHASCSSSSTLSSFPPLSE